MGEWSDYFEDFPEENPANHFDHEGDAEKRMGKRSEFFPQWREGQLTKAERAEVDAKIDSINAAAVKEAKDKADFIREAKTYPLLLTDECPQCYSKEMNIYKISDLGYFCHCQYCDVSASTRDYKQFLESLGEAVWKQPE